MIGWQARRFHHVKSPKAMDHYLIAASAHHRPRKKGGAAVLAMFRAKLAKAGSRPGVE